LKSLGTPRRQRFSKLFFLPEANFALLRT